MITNGVSLYGGNAHVVDINMNHNMNEYACYNFITTSFRIKKLLWIFNFLTFLTTPFQISWILKSRLFVKINSLLQDGSGDMKIHQCIVRIRFLTDEQIFISPSLSCNKRVLLYSCTVNVHVSTFHSMFSVPHGSIQTSSTTKQKGERNSRKIVILFTK
jgi:hypothetical protein